MKYNVPMRKVRMLLILGIWLAILPYLGFPYSWKDTLVTVSGLFLMFLSYLIYLESRNKDRKIETFDNFRENRNFDENQVTEEEIETKDQEKIEEERVA